MAHGLKSPLSGSSIWTGASWSSGVSYTVVAMNASIDEIYTHLQHEKSTEKLKRLLRRIL